MSELENFFFLRILPFIFLLTPRFFLFLLCDAIMLFSALFTAAAALLGPARASPLAKRQATLCVLGIHEIVQDRRFVLPLVCPFLL